ncbi:uncharacterized protein EV154DRAFT_503114 [Mucor mucedo]|uniref:uncharacterized protein n=1 Tax=Mucor mucedo TaxID=29922 RepID=UPI00221E6896|nr:uncharacterized protein EV154DRAFT_503114 [Mucor mucedo]KAI7893059.1 hypothetical protein EV154DRAFT_503114 [Mucor mucedo]
MKIVALVSGGKDSCYNMMQCVANGHEIAAIANLKPPIQSGKDELDSFMYQTVGHDAIYLYSECMDVPLYRRDILGGSLLQGSDYTVTADDETEDLYMLLKDVLKDHPDIGGVSVGAILSNYQRVRVEHVCNRLGLTSFAYLWRREQKDLLWEMANAGVTAILIKIAAIGLKPIHLGKSIAQMYPYLCKMNDMYDLHICGEGGEYETFTVDCPLFKRRIVVEETETVIHSDDAFAQVAYLKFKKCTTVEKTVEEMDMSKTVIQNWKDWDSYDEIVSAVNNGKEESLMIPSKTIQDDVKENEVHIASDHAPFFAIGGTTAYDKDADITFNNIEEETMACMKAVGEKLAEKQLEWKDVVTMNVFVRNMNDFGRINAVYKTFFDINPSPRALVGVNLDKSANLQIDLVAIQSMPNVKRETMHVQGISYWAPANIGPYSQSVITQGHAFVAGQIGLVPNTLDLPTPSSFADEAALSLRNLENIVSVLELPLQANIALCYCFVSDPTYLPLARSAWETYMEGDTPPTVYIAVSSLPKNAMVEWQVLLNAPLPVPFGEEEYDNTTDEELDDETIKALAWMKIRQDPFEIKTVPGVQCKAFAKSNVTTIVAQITDSDSLKGMTSQLLASIDEALKESKKKWEDVLSLRIFYRDDMKLGNASMVNAFSKDILKRSKHVPAMTGIPVTALNSRGESSISCTLHVL